MGMKAGSGGKFGSETKKQRSQEKIPHLFLSWWYLCSFMEIKFLHVLCKLKKKMVTNAYLQQINYMATYANYFNMG